MKTNKQHSDFINFRNYYTGNMSTEEKTAFEKHLENDPFAKEAYEGFETLENNHARISTIENTNMILKDKFGLSNSANKNFPLKYLVTIAASLVLFIGSYFVIQSNLFDKNTELADNHIEQETTYEIIEEETVPTYNKEDSFQNNLLIDSMEGSETDLMEDLEAEETMDEIEAPIKDKVTAKPEKKQKQNTDKPAKTEKQISEHEFDYYRNLKERNSQNGNNTTSEVSSPKEVQEEVSAQATNTIYADDSEVIEPESLNNVSEYKKGITAYNKSEYVKAIKYFNGSISQNKSISSSNYYIGMSYFNQNKSLKAIKYFDKTIASGSKFKDNAMWYKSLTLLKRGEKIEAKSLLTQISNSNSIFKTAANDKLKTLD